MVVQRVFRQILYHQAHAEGFDNCGYYLGGSRINKNVKGEGLNIDASVYELKKNF